MLFDERLYYTKFSGKTKKSPLGKVGKSKSLTKDYKDFIQFFKNCKLCSKNTKHYSVFGEVTQITGHFVNSVTLSQTSELMRQLNGNLIT